MRKLLFLGSLVSFGLFAACGGGGGTQTPTETPTATASASAAPSATESAAPSASAATVSWDQMDHAQRLATMKNVVLPKLGADFKAFDAKHYDNFSCVTCHGERIKQGDAKMPNPDLPHLNYTDNFKKQREKHNAMVDFMMQKVEPDMAAALGLRPFDPQTKTGFGCMNCHIVTP